MVFEFKLPDIGEGVHEGEVVTWLVDEGQTVDEDQPIVEVMTDKATVEITSPRAGTVAKLHAGEGDVVTVGEVLISIDEGDAEPTGEAKPRAEREVEGDGAPAQQAETADESEAAEGGEEEEEEEMTLFSAPDDDQRRRRRPRRGTAANGAPGKEPSEAAHAVTERAVDRSQSGGKTLATPATRKLARDLGVDIDRVPGSGPKGRVMKEDVRQFADTGGVPAAAAGPGKMAAPTLTARPEEERVPIRGLRKAIFDNMRTSKDYAAHFTYWDEVDVTELVKLRKDAKQLAEAQGVKLTYLPFLVKATVAALKEYPDINALMDEQQRELVRQGRYNIGVATATDRGLMVVVVDDADRKSVFEIAAEISELAEKARNGKAALEDLTGSTFTITSLGRDGGLGATPVINHPEVAIMGVHNIRTLPRFDDAGEVVPRSVMNLSWSFDHRVIDGHIGAAFAQRIKQLVEKPNLLLLGTA